jgi:hypothetical protein
MTKFLSNRFSLGLILFIAIAIVLVLVPAIGWPHALAAGVIGAFMLATSIAVGTAGPILGITPNFDLPANASLTDFADKEAGELKVHLTAMLSALPPVEQIDAKPELVAAHVSMKSSGNKFLELVAHARGAADFIVKTAEARAEKAAEEKLIATGNYIKKADSEAAVTAAKAQAEKDAKEVLEKDQAAKAAISTARAKLVTDKVVVQAAADALPNEFFANDGFEDRKTKLSARIKKLGELLLDKSEGFVVEMAALPYDEAGDKAFETRVANVKGLVGVSASRQSSNGRRQEVPVLAASGGDGGEPVTPRIMI